MNNKIDVSIILVNWNAKELLKACIDSIIKETKLINYEIILIDNNSTDGSVELIENTYGYNVTLIKNNENKGFASANNQGMKISSGKYILLLNSDTVILNNSIQKCFAKINTANEIGLLGCKLLNSDCTLQPSIYNFNSITRSIMFKTKLYNILNVNHRYKYEGLVTSFDYNREIEVDYVCGAFMFFKKELINKIGYLDESFFMYAEEADYCARAKKAGYKIMFFPGAEVIHFGGGSSKKISSISENRRIVSRLKFLRKHKGNLYFNIYRLLSIVIIWIKIIKLFIKSDKNKINENKSKYKAVKNMKYD